MKPLIPWDRMEYVASSAASLPAAETGCRLWPHATDKDGYGVTTVKADGLQWAPRVHRVVLSVAAGRHLADVELACHSCDTPGCVELSHLWVGSAGDNARDAHAKGRHPNVRANLGRPRPSRGESHGRHKLTAVQVAEIRSLAGTASQYEIAQRFGVSQPAISNISTGKTWAD